MSGVDDRNCGIKGDASKVTKKLTKTSGKKKSKSVQVRGCECPGGSNKRGCSYFVILQGEGFCDSLSMGAQRRACAGNRRIDGGVEQTMRMPKSWETLIFMQMRGIKCQKASNRYEVQAKVTISDLVSHKYFRICCFEHAKVWWRLKRDSWYDCKTLWM